MSGYRIEGGQTILGYQRKIQVVRESDGEVVGEGEVFVDRELVRLMGPDTVEREVSLLAERLVP